MFTITGTHLDKVTDVKLGDVKAPWFVINSPNQITTAAFPVTSAKTVPIMLNGVRSNHNFTYAYNHIAGTATILATFGGPIQHGLTTCCTNPADGNIWFSDVVGSLFTITPTGTLTGPITIGGVGVINKMIGAPDGNVWMIVNNFQTLIKVTQSFTSPPGLVIPIFGICIGPDGNIWGSSGGHSIVKISTNGVVLNTYSFPTTVFLANAADGNLWATDGSTLYQINTSGQILQTFLTPTSLGNITFGNDGKLWFAGTNGVYTFDLTAQTFAHFPYTITNGTGCIAAGPDGNVWLSNILDGTHPNGFLLKVAPDGTITEYDYPSNFGVDTTSMCVGNDGSLYVCSVSYTMWKIT